MPQAVSIFAVNAAGFFLKMIEAMVLISASVEGSFIVLFVVCVSLFVADEWRVILLKEYATIISTDSVECVAIRCLS